MGYPWCRMVIPWWMRLTTYRYCWNFMMIYWSLPKVYRPPKPRSRFVHPWCNWWITSHKWGGCCFSSGPWTLPDMQKITCLTPTWSFCYPCNTWRVDKRMSSIDWISASQYLIRYHQQWISSSSIPKYLVWPWGSPAWNENFSWSPILSWCLRILSVCLI